MRKRQLSPLGVIVKKRLIEIGKKQVELAKEIGTSGKYLHLILIGERSGKSFIPKIAEALGLSLDKLNKIA